MKLKSCVVQEYRIRNLMRFNSLVILEANELNDDGQFYQMLV